MNDKRLRHQRLYKPAGLKQGCAAGIPAGEDTEHDKESRVVENRADGPNEKDETFDLRDVPRPGARHLFVSTASLGMCTWEKS